MEVMDTQMESLEEEDDRLQEVDHYMTGLFSKLPIGIIIDILSRLPTKTLSQCRWVCKPWYNLIHLPSFKFAQHARAIEMNSLSIIFEDAFSRKHLMIDHQDIPYLAPNTRTYHVLGEKGQSNDTIVGSCNGLLCFCLMANYQLVNYFMCNPITGEKMILPLAPKSEIQDYIVGFGFDSAAEEYKFLRVIDNAKNDRKHLEAQVYALSSSSWRNLPKVPLLLNDFSGSCKNVFVHGALHWMGYKIEETVSSMCIFSFDVGTEEFREIPLPSGMPIACSDYLLVVGEDLSLICRNRGEQSEVWVMKEYGVQGSWTKEFSIKNQMDLFTHPFRLVNFMKNGEVLVQYGETDLGYYDPKTRILRPTPVQGIFLSMHYSSPFLHLDSLICPWNFAGLKTRS